MNEILSGPFGMFLIILCLTIFVGVTIGVVAGYFLSKRRMKKWLSSQSTLVDQNIETWHEKLKPIEGHVTDLKQTKDDFATTQERYEQLAIDFRGHETGIKNHLSRADAILNTYQRELYKKDQDERLDATDIKNQLQQLRQFTSDVTNHHKYNSLVKKLPALKSEKFEEISDDFFEINAQLQNFKKDLSPEEQNALLEQWKVFGELLAAMIECISKELMAECTKAIDPSREKEMQKKLEAISEKFNKEIENFVKEIGEGQIELQKMQKEQQQEYVQQRGQSQSR